MEIFADVGGTPGKDCGGFCEFCLFKPVNYKKIESLSIGCRHCPPNQLGCNHCNTFIKDIKNGFKPPFYVLRDLQKDLIMQRLSGSLNYKSLKINVGSWADIIFYPHLPQLVSAIKQWGLPVHLGYTSGKGIHNEHMADSILSMGVDEVSFSVFSTDPEIRRKWMRDKTPEESLNALKIFCECVDVNGSTVVIPGIIDQGEIFRTCSTLEDWGVKTFTLIRFANFRNQGLILNSRPVIDGINPHSFKEFQELVRKVADEFNFKIVGAPASDPENDIPFALSRMKNREHLEKLPQIKWEATILTSKLSAHYLEKIMEVIDEANLVNVIAVDKEIADLITHDDLASVNLDEVKKRVIIPGGALVHDKQAQKFLNKDGMRRLVIRGPLFLSPLDLYGHLNKEEIIKHELKAFKVLIDKINQ